MSNLVREYIEALPDDEKKLIITSYEEFERVGSIGNESLRIHTETMLKQNLISDVQISIWMRDVAFECYRYFANQYFRMPKH